MLWAGSDLVVVAVSMLFAEALILGGRQRILSPATLFVGSFLVTYLIPLFLIDQVDRSRVERLSDAQIATALGAMRTFFYTWCSLTLIGMARLARTPVAPFPAIAARRLTQRSEIVVFLFAAATIAHLGAGLEFSPTAILDRIINPRAYTYLASGLGPLTHLRSALHYSSLTLALLVVFTASSSFRAKATLWASVVLGALGGGKSSLLGPFIAYVVVRERLRPMRKSFLRRQLAAVGLGTGSMLLLIVGFSLLSKPGETLDPWAAISRIPEYQQEAYYLPLVIERYEWSPSYFREAVTDIVVIPIPRFIWPAKPPTGFYNRIWRDDFEPTAVSYHTSTFGCLSEAHMLLGEAGPWFYGLAFAWLTYAMYALSLRGRSLFGLLLLVLFSNWLYFLVRGGFTGTTFVVLLLYAVGGYVLTTWRFSRGTRPGRS